MLKRRPFSSKYRIYFKRKRYDLKEVLRIDDVFQYEKDPSVFKYVLVGVLFGAILGPVGMIVGAIIGAIVAPKKEGWTSCKAYLSDGTIVPLDQPSQIIKELFRRK